MNRRRLLKLSLFSSLALVSAGAVSSLGWLVSGYRPLALPARGEARAGSGKVRKWRVLGVRHQSILGAAALRVLDGALPTDEVGAATAGDACVFMDDYLAGLDPSIQSDFRALLDLLEYLPLITGHGGRFTRISETERDRVLTSWGKSSRALLRQGAQCIRSLCLLAHYQDASTFAQIGYSGPLVPARPDSAP